jgi:predicted alpha-1,2-mannosidase
LDTSGKPIHYSPWDGQLHDGVAYTDSGLWDTYRTQMPFLSIVYPEQLGDIVAGWLNAYREGGWLPQWPNPGGYRGMVGSHADAMVVDAMSKAITGFDYHTAYEALHRDAFDVPPNGPTPGGREGMANWLKLGYLPADSATYWVSTSLDYAYDDWCVAQAAKLTGHLADYRVLMQRSQNYRKLWDPNLKFMRSRDANGNWADKHFDPYAWGGGYTESGPWQASWAVQHDVLGLADLAGGPAEFARRLDHLFHQPSTFHTGGYGIVIHEMTEMAAANMGQFEPNNQPGFHIPYLYAGIGQPWKTEYWTRRACRELFNAGADGLCGDDDNGSLSSWYLLSSIGLYPLTPGQPSYVFTSPVFKSVLIKLPNGKTFTASAPNNSPANVYVQSRTLNGNPDDNTWITQQQIVSGGTMVDVMGDKAAERNVTAAELPYSAKNEIAASQTGSAR